MNYDFLLNLHRADLAWLDLDRRLKEFPVQIRSLEEEIARLGSSGDAKDQQLRDLEHSIRRMEQDLQQKTAKLNDLRVREGAVQSLKALEAGESEIAQVERSIGVVEDRLLEKIESKEILERELSLRAPEDETALERLQGEIEALRSEERECRLRLEAVESERQRSLAALDERTRRRYERVAGSFPHNGLAAVAGGACGGCGETLPPQELLDIKQKRELQYCQGCGRLVLWVEP
jgi:predicted  nucleic acid-binding Zn-ribbon protein